MQQIVTKQNQLVGFILLLTLNYFLLKFFFFQAFELFDVAVFVIGIVTCFVAMHFLEGKNITREDVESPLTKALGFLNISLVIVFFALFVLTVYKQVGEGVVVLFAQFGIVAIIGFWYLKTFGNKAKKFKQAMESFGLQVGKTALEAQAVYSKFATGRILEADEYAAGIIDGKFVRVGLCKKRSKHGPMFSLIIAVSPIELNKEYNKALGKLIEMEKIEKSSKRNNTREKDAVINAWWKNFEDATYPKEDDEEKEGYSVLTGKKLVEFEEELQDDVTSQIKNAVKKSEEYFV